MPGLFEALRGRGFDVDVPRNIREFQDEGLTVIRYGDIVLDLLQPIISADAHVLDRAVSTEILGHAVANQLGGRAYRDEADCHEAAGRGPTSLSS